MRNNKTKKVTIEALDVMIQNVAQGASGFWVEDYEGCGNPKIFSEFEEGLKRGQLVQKEHYLCPWNTAVLYGEGEGVLPLLTSNEINFIENEIKKAKQSEEKKRNEERNARLKKAAALIAQYPNGEALLSAYYGEKDCVSRENGIVFFNPDSQKDVVGAEKMSYDEYLSVQLASLGHDYRSGFANGLFNYLLAFKGQIEKINAKHICFKRIFISGMYPDGVMFDDKEDHVWMDKTGFKGLDVGDSVSFCADVYRYIKTGNGKLIDYGLRNPTGIKKIKEYQLPSDDQLRMEMIGEIICETCYLSEHCNRVSCLLPKGAKKEQNRHMMDFLKKSNNIEN